MAITLRNTSINAGSGTSISVSLPTGTTVGDLTIIAGSTNAGTGTYAINLPSGWTPIFNGGGQCACYRLFQSGDPSTVSLSYGSSVSWGMAAISYIGCDATIPVDTFSSGLSYVSGGSPGNVGRYTAPSINPSWSNDLLVAIYLESITVGVGSPTLPTGFTQRVVQNAGPNVSIGDKQLATAAATGPQTATWNTAATWMCVGALVALHASGDTSAIPALPTMSIAAVWGNVALGPAMAIGLDHLGAQIGDLMILSVVPGSNLTITSAPPGWTQQVGANSIYVYTKTYQAGDANPSITASGSGTNIATHLFLLRPNLGADTPTIDVMGNAVGGANTVLPSLTPAGTNEYFLGICGQTNVGGTTWTPPGGITTQFNSPGGPSVIIMDRQGFSAATGTFPVGSSNTNTIQGFDMLVAMAPISAGGTGAQARALVMA